MERLVDAARIDSFIEGFCHDWLLDGPAALPPGLEEQGAELARRFHAVLADWERDELLGRAGSVSEERLACLLADLHRFAAQREYARH
jgi:hypothetical protein